MNVQPKHYLSSSWLREMLKRYASWSINEIKDVVTFVVTTITNGKHTTEYPFIWVEEAVT
jgi:hypothetical protein